MGALTKVAAGVVVLAMAALVWMAVRDDGAGHRGERAASTDVAGPARDGARARRVDGDRASASGPGGADVPADPSADVARVDVRVVGPDQRPVAGAEVAAVVVPRMPPTLVLGWFNV